MLEYCALRSVSLGSSKLCLYSKVVAHTQGVRRRLCAQKINCLETELEREFSVLEMESQAVVKRVLLKRLFKNMCVESKAFSAVLSKSYFTKTTLGSHFGIHISD